MKINQHLNNMSREHGSADKIPVYNQEALFGDDNQNLFKPNQEIPKSFRSYISRFGARDDVELVSGRR